MQEVKGLTNELYAYALAQKKTGLHANFRFIDAMVSEFRFFKKEEEEEEHGQSVKNIASFPGSFPLRLFMRVQ